MAKKPALKFREQGAPDLESLLELARQKSKAGRRALFTTVKDLLFESEGALTDRERALMGEILRKLIRDVERSLRKELAERLAERRDAPHELVVALANEEIQVAQPLLVKSEVLRNIDLIEVIRHRTQSHQLAVAMRKHVSEEVSQVLVETGDADVITTLLRNGDAAISRSLMEYLVAESKRVDTFQNPLVHRRDLPPDLARKMYWWVSAAMRHHIVSHFNIDPTALDDTIEGTVKETLEKEDAGGEQPNEAEIFAREMADRGRLTEDFLVQTLRQGEISLFEACFATATELPLKLTRRLLYEPGGEGLAVACKAAGFRRASFAKLFQLTRKASVGSEETDPREVARVSEFFERLHNDEAMAVVKRWRRDADYLEALSQIEGVCG